MIDDPSIGANCPRSMNSLEVILGPRPRPRPRVKSTGWRFSPAFIFLCKVFCATSSARRESIWL